MHASMHLPNPSYGWTSCPFSSGVVFRIQQNLSLSLSHNHPLSDLATGPWERVGGAVEDGGLGPRSTFIENIWKKKKDPCPPPHSVSYVHHFRFLLSRIYFFWALGFGLWVLGGGLRILCIRHSVRALDTINNSFTELNDVIDIEHWMM